MKGVMINRCEVVGGAIRLVEVKNIIRSAIKKANPQFISL